MAWAVGPTTGTSMPTPAAAPTSPAVAPKPESTPTSPSNAPNPVTPVTPVTPNPVTPEKPGTSSGGIPGTSPSPVTPDGGLVPPVPNKTSIEPTAADTGNLTVWVPNEAKVTINGMLTKSTGSKRHFVSYGLRPGYSYKYVVKAEIVREGKIVTEEQTVALAAGDRSGVAFGFNVPEGLASSN